MVFLHSSQCSVIFASFINIIFEIAKNSLVYEMLFSDILAVMNETVEVGVGCGEQCIVSELLCIKWFDNREETGKKIGLHSMTSHFVICGGKIIYIYIKFSIMHEIW